MDFSDEEIKDLQVRYKAEFGEEISREEVIKQGSLLVEFIGAVYGPMEKIENEDFEREAGQIE